MPVERSTTKSSMDLFSKLTSPRTRSVKAVVPSSGARKRSAVASLCGRARSAQKPS